MNDIEKFKAKVKPVTHGHIGRQLEQYRVEIAALLADGYNQTQVIEFLTEFKGFTPSKGTMSTFAGSLNKGETK